MRHYLIFGKFLINTLNMEKINRNEKKIPNVESKEKNENIYVYTRYNGRSLPIVHLPHVL